MLILPIAQEDNTVRRTPWVSYVIIGLCFFLYSMVHVTMDPSDRQQEFGAALHEALNFLFLHPHVEPPAELMRYIRSDAQEEIAMLLAERRAAVEGTITTAQLREFEARLEPLVAEVHLAWKRLPANRLGYTPAEGGVIAIFLSMFMHGGWLHLVGNMLFLFLSGPFIEDRFGRAIFAALYLASGVVATLTHAARDADSIVPLVGASGAIAGVMGAFLLRLGTQRIRFLVVPFLFWPRLYFKVLLPAYVVLPLWLGENIWYASTAPDAGTAWWAHIGGFVFGALATLGIIVSGIEERWINTSIEKQISIVQHPGLEKAIDARNAGDLKGARREIRGVLTAEPNNVDAWTESYEIAVAAGDYAEAGRAAQRVLEMHTRSGEKDLAWHLISDACERVTSAELPVRFLMSAAGFLEKEGDARTAIEMYDQVTARAPQDPAAFRAWFRRAELLRASGDSRGAREAYEQARQHPSCVDPQLVDRALSQLGG